ncbi:hypothetical protein ACPOL_3549 [Acidisarcina polymorpha]|uniref:Uncharacterized protein n=1 Tax=Acidisarcina polymorpha TaxID=2211140 RepID=A0A2Z5G212_9BACT|nr:hypothetical protein [Acidisarcina polymorpha]AXC12834.1 hypothetical protein ACPOL_3549 [Acidisarcina polymorpha]
MAEQSKVEKFSMSELSSLRSELMQSGIDSWQAADVVSAFLVGRGYGVNTITVRDVVTRLDPFSASMDAMDIMQEVLETVAYVM